LHLDQIALRECDLFLLRPELPLEDSHTLPVLYSEALRHRDGFLILDLGRETAAAFGIRQTLALERQLPLRAAQRFAHLLHGHLRLDDRFAHLSRQVAQIARRRRRIQGRAESISEALEQRGGLAQLLRTVLAKNGENTGSTARAPHFGHAGRSRPCSPIGSWRVNRSLHFVQAYS